MRYRGEEVQGRQLEVGYSDERLPVASQYYLGFTLATQPTIFKDCRRPFVLPFFEVRALLSSNGQPDGKYLYGNCILRVCVLDAEIRGRSKNGTWITNYVHVLIILSV